MSPTDGRGTIQIGEGTTPMPWTPELSAAARAAAKAGVPTVETWDDPEWFHVYNLEVDNNP